MNINELLVVGPDPEPRHQSGGESAGITLTQFSDEDVDPELRELSELLVGVESAVQARIILSFFFPSMRWGGRKV